jgi:hypothetical protein
MANRLLYGFVALKDLVRTRALEVNRDMMISAIETTLEEHNRSIDNMIALFCRRTTDFKTRFRSMNAARLQALDEHGKARPIKGGAVYDVAYPLQMAGAAWGQTFVAMQKMTVQEVNDLISNLLTADVAWVRDHILAALFTNVDWTFTDDENGALTVKALANGDATQYLLAGSDQLATDTHFLAQAGAILDASNPFPVIYAELSEHKTVNAGEVISFIPSNQVQATKNLATFFEAGDPAITEGANATRLTGTLGVATPGNLIGRADLNWIVEWPSLPNDYVVSVMSDGDRPLAMREDAEPQLQGFKPQQEIEDYPYFDEQWFRRAGYGAWNRLGAVITRIGNGAYAIPTGFTSPMTP